MSNYNILQNLHTHTRYCDGMDTPEEMVITAIEKGFDILGFSGHSYTSSAVSAMSPEKEKAYKRDITALKERYMDQIDIYCGLELDLYSGVDVNDYDYVIGSVHYLKMDGQCLGIDSSPEKSQKIINEHFSGNGMKYARAYYETLAQLTECPGIDIVGHFDLVTKFCRTHIFFDVESKEYQRYAMEALDALASGFQLFELNTGAIARGYRTTPYPAPFLLRELKKRNCGILISSDCHDRRYLDCGFQEAEELLRECGFREKYILTKDGFEAVPIK